jgi:hypothetical protein
MKVVGTTMITAVAALALLVPATGAATRPDDRDGARGPGAFVEQGMAMDPSMRASIQDAKTGIVRPDDRPGRREVPLSAPSTTDVVTDSFDWSDAGIGAGAVAGTGLLAIVLAGLALARYDRRRLGHA